MRPQARATVLQRRCNITVVDAGLGRARNGRMMDGAEILSVSPLDPARRRSADPRQAAEIAEAAATHEIPENGENGENTGTLKLTKTRKSVKPARALPHASTIPSGAPLTLPRPSAAGPSSHRFAVRPRKREREFRARFRLPLAGSNREAVRRWGEGRAFAPTDETLKQAPPCTARETLKQGTPPASRIGPETVKHRRKEALNQGLTCFTPTSPTGPPETVSRRCDTVGEAVKHGAAPLPVRRARGLKQ